MIQKYSVTNKKFLLILIFLLIGVNRICAGIKMHGVADLLYNFEALDPDVLNMFTFNNNNRPSYRKGNSDEMDISDIDTSDILNCFSTLSYLCFQKKIIMYIDSLNRVNKVNLFGGYVSFVKVSQGVTPPITEQLLASRHITDENSLRTLLREMFEDFIDSHILRITVPVINAKLDARTARGHCYEFNLVETKTSNNETNKDLEDASKAPTCYRGDQSMVTLSSALMMKMFMLVPTLLKVIAAKAIFGLVMAMMSVVLSKMAILPLLLSYASKNKQYPNTAAPAAGSYRQGTSSPTNFALTTDNYGTYFPQEEQPGRLATSGLAAENDLTGPDYLSSGLSNDNVWSESKFSTVKYNNPNINNNNNQNKEFNYIPRKERFRSISRRSVSKQKKSSTYPEMVINGRSIESSLLTTAETSTVKIENHDEVKESIPARVKRWFSEGLAP